MAICLSKLTSLEPRSLELQSPRYCIPPPPTRSILPALTYFDFDGVSMYLEGLEACIDAPQLKESGLTFYDEISSHTHVLTACPIHLSRTEPEALDEARLYFGNKDITSITDTSLRTPEY